MPSSASVIKPNEVAVRPWISRTRRLAQVFALVTVLYAVTLAGLYHWQEKLAFPGWSAPHAWLSLPMDVPVEEFTVPIEGGASIAAWWLPPDQWQPADGAVFYLHGNSENLSTCSKTLVRWRDEMKRGVLAIDYPGYGHSTGVPTEQSCYAAGRAALAWLSREEGVERTSTIIVGQSLGCGIAVELAQEPCEMLVTSGAFTSFPEIAQAHYFWLPARRLSRLQFNNLAKVAHLPTPIFIEHGREDHVVPCEQAQRLFAAATGPRQLLLLAGQHHAHPQSPEFYAAVRAFQEEQTARRANRRAE